MHGLCAAKEKTFHLLAEKGNTKSDSLSETLTIQLCRSAYDGMTEATVGIILVRAVHVAGFQLTWERHCVRLPCLSLAV